MSCGTVCRVDTSVDEAALTGCGKGQGSVVAVTVEQAED